MRRIADRALLALAALTFVFVLFESELLKRVNLRVGDKPVCAARKFALIVCGSNDEFFRIIVNDLHNQFRGVGFSRENVTILENQNKINPNTWYTIRGNATKQMVLNEIAYLARIAMDEDTVVIHFSDHGDPAGLKEKERSLDGGRIYTRLHKECSVRLADGNLEASELREALGAIHARLVIVSFDCCFSGGMARVIGKGNVVALASAWDNEWSFMYGMESVSCLFYNAFLGNDDRADVDGDGKVSIEEAYHRAVYLLIKARRDTSDDAHVPMLKSELPVDNIFWK